MELINEPSALVGRDEWPEKDAWVLFGIYGLLTFSQHPVYLTFIKENTLLSNSA